MHPVMFTYSTWTVESLPPYMTEVVFCDLDKFLAFELLEYMWLYGHFIYSLEEALQAAAI